MTDSARSALERVLLPRQASIAEAWYAAIARSGFAPYSPEELRRRLWQLTGQAIKLLLAPAFEPDRAAQIGVAFASLHYTQPEALGHTQSVLATELSRGLTAEQVVALGPALAALLEGVAIGFVRERTRIELQEQESIRTALVSELRAAEHKLREARDSLEEQVAQRTEELRASEQRYRELLGEIDAVVATVDREGIIRYASPQLTRLFGLDPSEVVGRPFLEFLHAEDLPRIQEQFAQASKGRSDTIEFRFMTRTGELHWVHASVRPLFSGGEITGANALLTDVTDRRRAEEALRESEERWRTLVSNAPDPVITLNREGRIEFANYSRPESGWANPDDLLGRCVYDMLVPEHREPAEATLNHTFETGSSGVYETAMRRPNGKLVWYAAHVRPLFRDGQVVAVMVIARDITERKRIAEIKDNLLRDVSHELRTPLARSLLSLDLLLERLQGDRTDREGALEYGRVASDNIQKLANTVGAILDLSQLEAGAAILAREPIAPADLISGAVREMGPLALDKGLTLTARTQENLPAVQGDREKLSRALRNLIDNAVKFSSSGQIVVSAERKQDEVEIAVSDSGRGILPENLDRVFDRFFRESTEQAGVGVGLPMCKAIVEAHDGRVWAESAGSDQGTTVRIRLPAAQFPAQ